jgi:hypothetical protein
MPRGPSSPLNLAIINQQVDDLTEEVRGCMEIVERLSSRVIDQTFSEGERNETGNGSSHAVVLPRGYQGHPIWNDMRAAGCTRVIEPDFTRRS